MYVSMYLYSAAYYLHTYLHEHGQLAEKVYHSADLFAQLVVGRHVNRLPLVQRHEHEDQVAHLYVK